RPAHAAFTPLRRGSDVMATQNVAHRDLVDAVAQIRQGALDTAISPRGILFRHAHDELFNFLINARSAALFSLQTAIELGGNQAFVPAHERIRRGDGGSSSELLAARRVGYAGTSPALRGGQPPAPP